MKETFLKMKQLFAGKWQGEGFAQFPTIAATAYTEQLEWIPDSFKDALFFQQKTFYRNNTERNGQTVFWDTGFIILKEEKVLLQSVQSGGRMEEYELVDVVGQVFTFNSFSIVNDSKSTRSQRIFRVGNDDFHYELNMALQGVAFQNHLVADLKRVGDFSAATIT